MEYNYPLIQYLSTYSVLGILLIFCCIIWILEQNIKFVYLILKIVNKYLRSDSETPEPKSTKIADESERKKALTMEPLRISYVFYAHISPILHIL